MKTESTIPPAQSESESAEPATSDPAPADMGRSWSDRRAAFKRWLSTRRGRWIFGGAVFVLVAALILAVPFLRYHVVGLVWHSNAQIRIVDSATGQPLPDATVTLGGATARSDYTGLAQVDHVQLGKTTLQITKTAYKPYAAVTTVGLRRYHASIGLVSIGVALHFRLTDKISGQALDGVALNSGSASASSQAGSATLSVLPTAGSAPASVKLTKTGYIDATVTVPVKVSAAVTAVALVPAGQVYYLSNRAGRIDLYTSHLDGSQPEVALAGNGNEDAETGILPSVTHADLLALVSSRAGHRTAGGGLIHDLYLFNGTTRQLTLINANIDFGNFRAWTGDYLVYEQQQCGPLMAYSVNSGHTTQLVAGGSGCVRATLVTQDNVFYSLTQGTASTQGLYVISAAGQGQRHLSSTPADSIVWQTKRTVLYEYYNYSQPQPPYEAWSSLDLSGLTVTKLANGPSLQTNRIYIDTASGQAAAFIDERDGKSELYVTDANGANERKLTSFGSVNQFVQWYGDDYIVFSSTKSDENALYVVAAAAGAPQKVADFYRGNSRTYAGGYNPAY